MKVLFFAWCREQLGQDCLELALDAPLSVKELKQQLAAKGELWQSVFENTTLLCAVNQSMASEQTALSDSDEVAFFPPVTGG